MGSISMSWRHHAGRSKADKDHPFRPLTLNYWCASVEVLWRSFTLSAAAHHHKNGTVWKYMLIFNVPYLTHGIGYHQLVFTYSSGLHMIKIFMFSKYIMYRYYEKVHFLFNYVFVAYDRFFGQLLWYTIVFICQWLFNNDLKFAVYTLQLLVN